MLIVAPKEVRLGGTPPAGKKRRGCGGFKSSHFSGERCGLEKDRPIPAGGEGPPDDRRQ